MKAFVRFMQGLLRMPLYARIWVMALMAGNMLVPLFYLASTEAKVVLAVMIPSAMLMTLITARTGFSRLLGAGHFAWFPLIVYLVFRFTVHPADDFFGIWLRVLVGMNGISLIIDTVHEDDISLVR